MLITYIYRHGWRHSLKAFFNLILLTAITILISGIIALNSMRSFYIELDLYNSDKLAPSFWSWIIEVLYYPRTAWALIFMMIVIAVKEFFVTSIAHRLIINSSLLLLFSAAAFCAIYVLYFIPINAAS